MHAFVDFELRREAGWGAWCSEVGRVADGKSISWVCRSGACDPYLLGVTLPGKLLFVDNTWSEKGGDVADMGVRHRRSAIKILELAMLDRTHQNIGNVSRDRLKDKVDD